jgi:hypothetical protein
LAAPCLRWLRALWACAWLVWLGLSPAQAYEPDIVQMSVQRTPEAVYLSARLKLEPAAAVEDALLRGVPLYFAWQADVYRYRWYWTDKRVASAMRTLRLVYQPLTRRWRLSLSTDTGSPSGAGLQYALHQNFDSLADALAGVGRVSRWKLADAARLQADEKHRVEWRFRLDLSLLPRPFQIGMANQPEWDVDVQKVLRVPDQMEPEPQPDAVHDPLSFDEPNGPAAAEAGR